MNRATPSRSIAQRAVAYTNLNDECDQQITVVVDC